MSSFSSAPGVNYSQSTLNTVTGRMSKSSKLKEFRMGRAAKRRYNRHTNFNAGLYRNVVVLTASDIASSTPPCFSALNELRDDDLKKHVSVLGFTASGATPPETKEHVPCTVSLTGVHPLVHNSKYPIRTGDAVGALLDLDEAEQSLCRQRLKNFEQPSSVENSNFEGVFPAVAPMSHILQKELLQDADFVNSIHMISHALLGTAYVRLDEKAIQKQLTDHASKGPYNTGIAELMTKIQSVCSRLYVGKAVSSPTEKNPIFSVVT